MISVYLRRFIWRAACVAICWQAIAACSSASVIVSNLGNTTTGSVATHEQYWTNPDPLPSGRQARLVFNSFTTGGAALPLDSVTLSMASSSVSSSTGFAVELRNDAGGAPGTTLIALSGNSAPVSAGLYDYVPSGSFVLQPTTTYWLYLHVTPEATTGNPAERTFSINTTSDTSETGMLGWSIGDASRQEAIVFDFPPPLVGEPLQFAVNAVDATEAVPEPATFILAALGLAGLGLIAWQRKKRKEMWNGD